MKIAALYVDTECGPYPKIPGVDCWDEERDARLFPGGCPVIAHPPCGPWGSLRQFCTKQNKDLAVIAVRQVLDNGGILEHPAYSTLWQHCDLPMPRKIIPESAAAIWALEIDQHRFGHKAQKKTWLLFSGIAPKDLPPPPAAKQHKPKFAIHLNTQREASAAYQRIPKKARHLTPPAFAKFLVEAARACNQVSAECA